MRLTVAIKAVFFVYLYCRPRDATRAEQVPRPTSRNLLDIAIANSIPFIGFGFLDNFFMLIFGDYIDVYLGSYFVLTTMAAAALGNTFSDILGIGTAFYVERLANKVGYSPPRLSPMQMDLPVSRNFANLGRVLGVTLGCILGMVPLLFFRQDFSIILSFRSTVEFLRSASSNSFSAVSVHLGCDNCTKFSSLINIGKVGEESLLKIVLLSKLLR
ncbi:Transmembrane protein 65 [Popillia japonica]|uniref:Transmembrane protein 65 n=1 Tax=Popillia japonica TaxID=7064 RepID=A0AAW1L8H2_POPJA